MLVFYDPNNDNQVMAFYTFGSSTKVWEERGYTRLEVFNEEVLQGINIHNRDCQLTIVDGEAVGYRFATNPLQPGPETFITEDELSEGI
tara:strand:- start:137 stop:403 length:267 start_codon:yes stop_codon:yes gene_type:complete